MKSYSVWAAAAVMCLGMTGCHKLLGHAAPTGQVVATVNGKEITLRELQAELGGATFTDPKQQKAVQERALEMIVARTLMANAARAQGIDKTPDFAMAEDRAVDNMLANALEAKVVKSVPAPTPDEVTRYITDHPASFSNRSIYELDEIRFARPNDPAALAGLQPLNTLTDIATFLTAHKIPFQQGSGTLDALQLDPGAADQIAKKPNEVFVLPVGNMFMVGQIKSAKVTPVPDDQATKLATAVLTRQHSEEAARREAASVLQAGAKSVQYNPAYQPAPPPKAPAQSPTAATNAAS
jgi:EpsD family peptidyl-prolyl cis-trans isomerase